MRTTNTRRSFIRDTSLTATGLFFVSITGSKHEALKELAIGCAPAKASQLFGSIGSVKSGNWSDPATWGGRVPAAADTPLISSGHLVNYDMATTTVAGININAGGTLVFDATKSVTLQSNQNIVVQGILRMRPASTSQIHTLRFVGVNENAFVGGGMSVLATDIGLWVMAAGQLDIVGAEKTSWTRVTDTVAAGTSSFSLTTTPTGWASGDEVVLVPTSKPDVYSLDFNDVTKTVSDTFSKNFEKRTISAISGSSVSVSSAFAYNTHQKVMAPDGPSWTAEILNLNRNTRIEGTATGRTHIFIMSSVPQTLRNTALRYMGPRKDADGNGRPDMIAGRYAIHFHHCGHGSNGSQVTGNVVSECGNHSYVPHVSHGINMSNNVAYDCIEVAFWWDFGHMTHNATWNNNLVALNYYVPKSIDMAGSESGVAFTGGGMLLGIGDGNVAIGNTVVYAGVGDTSGKGGFIWEANNEGIWIFENNLAHSNHIGIRVWQNTVRNHTIFNQDCYNNVRHLFHGAYGNAYTYRGGYFYDGEVEVKASSANSAGVRFENVKFHANGKYPHCVNVTRSAIPSPDRQEDLFLNCTFRGFTSSAIRNEAGGVFMDGGVLNERKGVALVMCDFGGGQPWSFTYNGPAPEYITNPTGWFRIQPKSGQSQLIVKGTGSSPVITNINPFFPTLMGTGKGLKGEYFNDANFGSKVLERIDSVLMFSEWHGDREFYQLPLGVHHLIKSEQHSTRWTGKVMAQYSEAYTFRVQGSGGYRLWINGSMIIDKWAEKADDSNIYYSTPIQLTAGQLADIKVEYFSNIARTSAQLFWKCNSMEREVLVPQSQLYSDAAATGGGTTGPVVVEPVNKVPIANAGADITITLPSNSVTLNGSLSTDPDGTISSYQWTKVNGPSQFTISNPSAASTTVTNMVTGIYTFRLQVTDAKGATATDEVVVVVNAVVANQGPVAHAGSDITVTLPTNSATLNGTASKDPDGSLVSYLWTKVSGPTAGTIASPTSATTTVSGLALGIYTFRLQVQDDKGAIATDDVVITVSDVVNKGPIANAGADQTLTLPTAFASLNGTASSDPDGSIVAYQWTKVSGPTQGTLSSATGATVSLSNLAQGVYVYRLQVVDNRGAQATDDVTITVNANTSSSTSSTQLGVVVGPNPTTTNFRIQVSGPTKFPITICIYDQNYKEVAIYKGLYSGATIVVGDSFRPGTYFIWADQNLVRVKTSVVKLPM